MTTWGEDIFQAFKDWGLRQIAYVPDAGHKVLIEACRSDENMCAVPLTTEEEGIALLAGAWLGGDKGALLLQSSGVGNCINMLSLAKVCRFPLAMFVTMRGEYHEFNPWQVPMGRNTQPALEAAGVFVETAGDPGSVAPRTQAALHRAFVGGGMTAVLLSQALMPVKTFGREME